MKCPLCRLEMSILASRHKVINDTTPDAETKLFIEHDMTCRNKQCPNHGKVVEIIQNPIKLG